MIELTSPPLRNCPLCNREPEVERGYDYNNLDYSFLRVKCPECRIGTSWVKYSIAEDLSSLQKAIDETSNQWNTFKILDNDDE